MKTAERAFNHIKLWNEWRKKNTNSKFYKFMVLTKFVVSPTFETHKAYKNWNLDFAEMEK